MNDELAVAVRVRNKGIKIKPYYVDAAYRNPDSLIDAVKRSGPHRNFFEVEDYEQGGGAPVFRAYWLDFPGSPLAAELQEFLYNQVLIEATKGAYGAEVVRPIRVIINLNVPGPAHEIHTDYPDFRGIPSHPTWVPTIMGWSGLFESWEVQVASGLAWFYEGENGGFRYWPNGADRPPRVECGPFWNRGLICDNDYTFHQVCSVGHPDQYMPAGIVGRDCSLHWDGARWAVHYNGRIVITYAFQEVRLMSLWKARVFKDREAAAIYDEHIDDLSYDRVFHIFAEDMRERGFAFNYPVDPVSDSEWKKLLNKAYPAPKPPSVRE